MIVFGFGTRKKVAIEARLDLSVDDGTARSGSTSDDLSKRGGAS